MTPTASRIDLTEDALRARGIGVDKRRVRRGDGAQKAAARAAWKGSGAAADGEVWFDIAEREGASEFTGYSSTEGEGGWSRWSWMARKSSRPMPGGRHRARQPDAVLRRKRRSDR